MGRPALDAQKVLLVGRPKDREVFFERLALGGRLFGGDQLLVEVGRGLSHERTSTMFVEDRGRGNTPCLRPRPMQGTGGFSARLREGLAPRATRYRALGDRGPPLPERTGKAR